MKDGCEFFHHSPGRDLSYPAVLALFYHSGVSRDSRTTDPFFLFFDNTRKVSISL